MESRDTVERDRARRMAWWNEARFGMFVHWGLYSVLGRHEWVMNCERIPVKEYEKLADRFCPSPGAPRTWARLAREAGQKYMVMTTKHCEGFCMFDSRLTDYCAPKCAAGRDLVAEYVEAARAEGLRVGLYYCIMDWHHPDGARCFHDARARRRFVDYTHGLVRELCTNYGKIDVLWYDTTWPLDARALEAKKLNAMVRSLQPDIIINNRSGVPEDFSTPEQKIEAAEEGRGWEACMTMNDSWGYNAGDQHWKSAHDCLSNLVLAAQQGGNYLLNIGPRADGSIPEPSVRVLREIGAWLRRNRHGESVYGTQEAEMHMQYPTCSWWTVKGRTAYLHVFAWQGTELTIGGFQSRILSVRLLASGRKVAFEQEPRRLHLHGLPREMPDRPATVLAIECGRRPVNRLGAGCVLLKGKD